uniref:Uncharacterized protein n=1 Tax=Rhizophagus irregularis (strain DAOM 181602 / DAOM 197198 / MUCL 43194) TaxID=747089 RepID=U9U0E3_RHIID
MGELSYLKSAIIKKLQKRLRNNYTAVGEQTFSLHCSENAFVVSRGKMHLMKLGKY